MQAGLLISDVSAEQLILFASTFALSPAETRVLGRVLSGRNVVEAAQDLSIAGSTVRSHLDNIFAKTGVSRQVHLVRLLAHIEKVPAFYDRGALPSSSGL